MQASGLTAFFAVLGLTVQDRLIWNHFLGWWNGFYIQVTALQQQPFSKVNNKATCHGGIFTYIAAGILFVGQLIFVNLFDRRLKKICILKNSGMVPLFGKGYISPADVAYIAQK